MYNVSFPKITTDENQTTKSYEFFEPIFINVVTTGENPFLHDIVEIEVLELNQTRPIKIGIKDRTPYFMADQLVLPGMETFFEDTYEEAKTHEVMTREKAYTALQEVWRDKVIVSSNPSKDFVFLYNGMWETLRELPTFHAVGINVNQIDVLTVDQTYDPDKTVTEAIRDMYKGLAVTLK